MSPRRLPAPLVDGLLIAVSAADLLAGVRGPREMALGALACLALTVRRRWPLPVFLLCLPSLLSSAPIAAQVALFTIAAIVRNRLVVYACGLMFTAVFLAPWPEGLLVGNAPGETLMFTAVFLAPWPQGLLVGNALGEVLIHLISAASLAAAPILIGRLTQVRGDLSLRLAELSAAREHERFLTAQTVLVRERTRLAREMHDVVAHQVSLIAVRAGVLQVATADPEVREAAVTIRGLSVDTLDELRHMVTVLRTATGQPAELTPQPGLADLDRLVKACGIEVALEVDLPGEQPRPPVQRAIYRVVQESLTNVRKHADGASAAVRIRREGDGIRTTVTNGPPTRATLPLPSARHGLIGLRERAELLGGSIEYGPLPDGGYRLLLRLPAEKGPSASG
ncbi:sensor histidine kinase [Rhizohabitans arisaemae]|uniref:sensor histidine kinase n=1 Tax=Rhizohabitans arisaemae TaxID=2720610 RepID=UPI0024B1B2C9|nr:histidine kinase [Rhizohabitans arisaemae]